MESSGQWNPLLSFSRFVHQHCLHLATSLEDTKRLAGTLVQAHARPKPALAATLSSQHVAKTLTGTSVYTVSNSNNEFVLISDADGAKSIGLLCFRQEDAEAFLAQVSYFFNVAFRRWMIHHLEILLILILLICSLLITRSFLLGSISERRTSRKR